LGDLIQAVDAGVSVNCHEFAASNGEQAVLKTSCVATGMFAPNENKVAIENERRRLKTSVRANTIIFCRKNTDAFVGASAFVECDNDTLFLPDLLWRIAPRKNVDPRWLSYLIASPLVRRVARSRATGSHHSMKNIAQNALLTIDVLAPEHVEQCRISELLRSWDEAICKIEQLITTKEMRRSWIRSQLLTGRLRIPGSQGEWRNLRLGEVLSEHGLKSSGNEEVFSVSVHKGLINQIEHLGRSFAATETWHYNRVTPGDIVYTKSPTGDFPLGIIKHSKTEKDVIVSPLYGVFKPTTPHLGVILDAFFESANNTKNYLAPLVQKGAKNTIAITNTRFLEGRIRVPINVNEQAILANLITAAKSEIEILLKEGEMLRRQKRGLMQKLFSGELRLPVGENEMNDLVAHATAEGAQ
jgi:type I restriction enzyme S subunit